MIIFTSDVNGVSASGLSAACFPAPDRFSQCVFDYIWENVVLQLQDVAEVLGNVHLYASVNVFADESRAVGIAVPPNVRSGMYTAVDNGGLFVFSSEEGVAVYGYANGNYTASVTVLSVSIDREFAL